MSATTEKVVLLGERKSIVAIATQPMVAPPSGTPAVVILNSGIIHRVGHNRMYVTLSRELAALGHTVLRVDLSGIGDSEPRSDILDPLAASLADIKDAIDWLDSVRGARRVILLGLCSGANQSVVYAGDDPRVVGLVLLDPFIPRTPRFYFNFFGSRLVRRDYWKKFLLGRASLVKFFRKLLRKTAPQDPVVPNLWPDEAALRPYVENAYRRAIQTRTQLLAVFTAGVDDQHNYRRQLLDAMPNVPFGSQLRLEYFDGCDHTFTLAADRRRLFDTVEGWLRTTSFVAAEDPPPSGA